jgi:dihydroorotase
MQTLEITAPDDLHLHVRDGDMLKAVLPHTTRIFRRCAGQTATAAVMLQLPPGP